MIGILHEFLYLTLCILRKRFLRTLKLLGRCIPDFSQVFFVIVLGCIGIWRTIFQVSFQIL